MSSLINYGKRILNHFCQQGIADRANFLKNIAVIGWVLSSLAQTTALVFNNEIPSKEKKFLIPQEIIDGITNVTLFWFVTSKATDFGKLLVLKKHILPKSIWELTENFQPIKGKNITELKDAFISHIKKSGGSNMQIKTATDSIEGMGVLSGIIGAILSYNICTPVIRNILASKYQKKEIFNKNKTNLLNPEFGKINYNKYKFDNMSSLQNQITFNSTYNNHVMKI